MVYSSRSVRSPRRRVVSRPTCSCMFERLTWRRVWERAEGICGVWGF
jgi:hypothetical protein